MSFQFEKTLTILVVFSLQNDCMLSSIYIVYTIILSFPCHIVFDTFYFHRVADDLATMVNDESLMWRRISLLMWLVHCEISSILPNVVAKIYNFMKEKDKW